MVRFSNVRLSMKDKECLPWYCVECQEDFKSFEDLQEHQKETGHK